jgi:hypothetical protein
MVVFFIIPQKIISLIPSIPNIRTTHDLFPEEISGHASTPVFFLRTSKKPSTLFFRQNISREQLKVLKPKLINRRIKI